MLAEWIMDLEKKEMEFCLQTIDSHNLQGFTVDEICLISLMQHCDYCSAQIATLASRSLFFFLFRTVNTSNNVKYFDWVDFVCGSVLKNNSVFFKAAGIQAQQCLSVGLNPPMNAYGALLLAAKLQYRRSVVLEEETVSNKKNFCPASTGFQYFESSAVRSAR